MCSLLSNLLMILNLEPICNKPFLIWFWFSAKCKRKYSAEIQNKSMNILKNVLSHSLLSMLLYTKNSFLLSLDFCACLFSSSLIISLIYINQNSENKEIAFSLPQKIKSNLPACQVVEPRYLYSLGLFFIILYEPSNSNPRIYKTI